MIRYILFKNGTQIGCQCRNYARNRFSRPSEAADPKKFVENIRALDRIPAKKKHYQEDEDPDDISRYESDFSNLNLTHKAHKQEVLQERERIKQRTVQAKYFRINRLNFLTWAEKEQIRHLHRNEPEEWSIEKLAESFPADCETIAKIIKASWTPKNSERICKHDDAVRQAWIRLREDKVDDIGPELKEHLQKFSGRTKQINSIESNITTKDVRKFEIKKDFSNILTSCKKYQQLAIAAEKNTTSESNELQLPPVSTEDTFVLGKPTRSKSLMFRDLDIHKNAAIKPHNPHNPFVNPRSMLKNSEDSTAEIDGSIPSADDAVVKYEMSEVRTTEDDMRKLSIPAIRDQIIIPKHLWQRGATYKLDDCFYDDDGEFLYRVPGMTGRK